MIMSFCCCCSVTNLCLTVCNPIKCSTPGFPVLHYLPVCSDSYALSVMLSNHLILCPPPSPPVLNLSQHQSLFL